MTIEILKTDARWKKQFEIMWRNTSKKNRKSISQVNNIKSQAKLFVSLWM
jgi:hypothetical protein